MNDRPAQVAIVDFGMGNLFSAKHACEHVGMKAFITSEKNDILRADAVILPGVGAFGDAMNSLRRLDLEEPLKDLAASKKPMMGICLGLQLLMTESQEFGQHQGLGIVDGPVVRFDKPYEARGPLKVPHIGWNSIFRPGHLRGDGKPLMDVEDPWNGTLLSGLPDGTYTYFVHSFYAIPENPALVLSTTRYGNFEFCSSLRCGNVFAFQFHPERSGPNGLRIYEQFKGL
ncbi:MAG: imidazole glycerol phosphate synthase subunit HisH, partial [Candidatus Marsarchaeota archaeon]|nr:imidazole glycerol phosphate synthase subunit HisH [Candidatus Marsarchaeota archaeon]